MALINSVSSQSTTGGLILDRIPRTIIMVRHGETRGNIDDKAQGHFDVRLTELGLRQAEALAHRLENVDIDAVYSSDLIRAADTAAALIALRPDLEIQTRAGLREVYFGSYEDMRWSEIREEDPELHERWTNWKTRDRRQIPEWRIAVRNAAESCSCGGRNCDETPTGELDHSDCGPHRFVATSIRSPLEPFNYRAMALPLR